MKQIEEDLKLNNPSNQFDTINLVDESLEIEVGHVAEDEPCNYTPPFYITMSLHGKLIHNCMLYYGGSHNLIPKVILDELGLEVTKPYHDLYKFDSKPMKCIGIIKDLVVTLSQLPSKRILLDVAVEDVPQDMVCYCQEHVQIG